MHAAESLGRVAVERCVDAQVRRGVGHQVGPDIQVELLVDRVVRQQRRLHEVDPAGVSVVVGLHVHAPEARLRVERLGDVERLLRIRLVPGDRG